MLASLSLVDLLNDFAEARIVHEQAVVAYEALIITSTEKWKGQEFARYLQLQEEVLRALDDADAQIEQTKITLNARLDALWAGVEKMRQCLVFDVLVSLLDAPTRAVLDAALAEESASEEPLWEDMPLARMAAHDYEMACMFKELTELVDRFAQLVDAAEILPTVLDMAEQTRQESLLFCGAYMLVNTALEKTGRYADEGARVQWVLDYVHAAASAALKSAKHNLQRRIEQLFHNGTLDEFKTEMDGSRAGYLVKGLLAPAEQKDAPAPVVQLNPAAWFKHPELFQVAAA